MDFGSKKKSATERTVPDSMPLAHASSPSGTADPKANEETEMNFGAVCESCHVVIASGFECFNLASHANVSTGNNEISTDSVPSDSPVANFIGDAKQTEFLC